MKVADVCFEKVLNLIAEAIKLISLEFVLISSDALRKISYCSSYSNSFSSKGQNAFVSSLTIIHGILYTVKAVLRLK